MPDTREEEPKGIPGVFGKVLGALFALMGRLLAGVFNSVLAAFGLKPKDPELPDGKEGRGDGSKDTEQP